MQSPEGTGPRPLMTWVWFVQVKDALADKRPEDAGPVPLMTSGREVLPALGLAWANCINTRIFLSRHAAPVPQAFHRSCQGPPWDEAVHGPTEWQRAMQVWFVEVECVQCDCDLRFICSCAGGT